MQARRTITDEGVDDMITDEQVAFYKTNGYLAVENLFTADEIEPLQRVLDEFIERGKKLSESDGVIELEESHTLENPRLRRIIWPDQ